MNTKIIALYLPQYHCIPENDEFWGKGFTDWVTVKNATPLFKGHLQPKVPLNDNYYDLSLRENVEWQCKLAYDNSIYGFGVYHYWFNNEKNLLTKPAEIMRDNKTIQTKYFFIWDNANWKRSWSNVEGNDWTPMVDKGVKKHKGPEILIPYILGREKDWENHYNYVKTHFLSQNYEKKDNMPVFGIITYSEELLEMCHYWDSLAKKDGFAGIHFIFQYKQHNPPHLFQYMYQPHNAAWSDVSKIHVWKRKITKGLCLLLKSNYIEKFDCKRTWRRLIKAAENQIQKTVYHGAFVSYDDSPRRGNMKSKMMINNDPVLFREGLKKILDISKSQGKEYVFLTAWNEWGEGAYLEPDVQSKCVYLQAIKSIMNS